MQNMHFNDNTTLTVRWYQQHTRLGSDKDMMKYNLKSLLGKIGGQDTRLGAIENIFDYPDYDGWLCSSGINDKYILKTLILSGLHFP